MTLFCKDLIAAKEKLSNWPIMSRGGRTKMLNVLTFWKSMAGRFHYYNPISYHILSNFAIYIVYFSPTWEKLKSVSNFSGQQWIANVLNIAIKVLNYGSNLKIIKYLLILDYSGM